MKLTVQRSFAAAIRLGVSVAWMSMSVTALAQGVTTTTVQGTVYLANGRTGSGTLQLSWPAFTTAGNQAVAAGRTNVTIGADGYVSVNLAPNVGSMPAGLYYTAVYHLSDGTTSTEYWVVPAAAQAALAQIRAQVMPAAQAVQAVSKSYVDQSIAELTQSLLTASGGTLSGPLYLAGDPTQPMQASTKRYVDAEFANAVPMSGAALTGPLTSVQLGAAYQVDQFPGADFGARLQACLNRLDAVYGGTCDARNFSGTLGMGSALVIATANATVQLPCATIATASQIQVTAGTRNVTLRGCALRGASSASGSQGGTVFLYTGAVPMMQVGDTTYATNTVGFHLDNVVINTTASANALAQALAAYRTQEMNLQGLYFLGNSNQTGMTLDGTGNYTGGTFQDLEFGGFGTAVNAIGHQVTNSATTDWLNASTFLRLHINCPTSGGSPVAETYGINLQQGDGNTFTGGDVEGCGTALHLGLNAQNNTIVGLRNENSISQVVADAGSSYNNWITGGTMFTGQLTDNGTRNSFLDTFHRSFNGLNGDWYGSQKDDTVTNHYRIGTGAGNERGLLNRYQTDYGYRWTTGLSDATAGEQFYQVLDELNDVYRLSIGQYNNGQTSTNNQTVINAAGSGAVVLNGSANSGTGGVIFGAGGSNGATVATINSAGNAQFNGSLQVSGPATFTSSATVKNQADAEIDSVLWAGASANQKESFIYKDYSGASQWYMVKDASNNWALNSAVGGLDSFKAYQSNNSGDTYINANKSTGHIRLNYESGSGAETDIYAGSSSALVAAFLGGTSIKFPGLAAASAPSCLQIDNSGYISNTGSACGTGGGGLNGTVSAGMTGQVAYYAGTGTVLAGMNAVAVSAGGTGASTAEEARENLGAQPVIAGLSSDGSSGVVVAGTVAAAQGVVAPNVPVLVKPVGGDISAPLNSAIQACTTNCSFLINAAAAAGTMTVNNQIVVNKPNVTIACQNPNTTVLTANFGMYPTFNTSTVAVTSGVVTVTTTATHSLVVGNYVSLNSNSVLGTVYHGVVVSVPSLTSYTMVLNQTHADLASTADSTGTTVALPGLIYAEADNFELANCGINHGRGFSNNLDVAVYATPTSTANNAKIHGNIFVDPQPFPQTYGYGPWGEWAANTTVATGAKITGWTGTTTRYLMVVTTAGTTGATLPTWNTTVGGTTTDGTAVWTNEQTYTHDGTVGLRVMGYDATHTADHAQIYDNSISYPFIDIGIATYASYADIHDNQLYRGEHLDLNGDSGNVSYTNFHHNHIYGGDGGSWVQDADHTIVAHNHFINYSGVGAAAIDYASPYLGSVNMGNIDEGNIYEGSAFSGQCIWVAQAEANLSIQNEVCAHAGVDGIRIDQGGVGASNTHIKNVVFTDNGQASPGSGTYCAVNIHENTGTETRVWMDITGSTTVDDQPSNGGPTAAATTQAYAVCASNGTKTLTNVNAYGNNFPVTAWAAASGNGTAFNFPNGCASCALNPTLPINGVGAAIATGPSTSTSGHVAVFNDTKGTLGDGGPASVSVNGTSCPIGGSCTVATGTAGTGTPAWLQYLGTGADGANTTASGNMNGEFYYTNFTVPFGNTVTPNGQSLIIHATGTCTIAGTINANTGNTSYGFGGGSGGGSGGGTAVGTAAANSYSIPGTAISASRVSGGTAGTSSGGNGGNGNAFSSSAQRSMLGGNGGGADGWNMQGSPGTQGGSTGGAAGLSGNGVILICGTITGTDGVNTGTINASGTAGGNSPGNNQGAGSGGGGGVVILSSQNTVTTWPTISVAGGSGGTCGSYTGCGKGGNGGNGWYAEFAGW